MKNWIQAVMLFVVVAALTFGAVLSARAAGPYRLFGVRAAPPVCVGPNCPQVVTATRTVQRTFAVEPVEQVPTPAPAESRPVEFAMEARPMVSVLRTPVATVRNTFARAQDIRPVRRALGRVVMRRGNGCSG